MRRFKSGEEMSVFFIGLLYFIVQWIWQMQNIKHEAAIPFAFLAMIAIAGSGALGVHVFLIYGNFPELRMRVVNALLFLPFVIIAIASYPSARQIALQNDPALAQKWWFGGVFAIAIAGIVLGMLPLIFGWAIRRHEARKSSAVIERPPSPA